MSNKFSILSVLFVLVAAWGWAQMTPNAPVRNFRMPRFSEDGYTQWVLQGGRGIYDSESQVRVEDMALRVYSGDERMAQELSLESPAATLRIQENRALSDTSIKIVGEHFEISGLGWTWDGTTKVIEVLSEAEVRFEQGFGGALSGGMDRTTGETTVIQSERLSLKTTEDDYLFTFSGAVQVESGTMTLECEFLRAEADAPAGREMQAPAVGISELNAIRQLSAERSVVIRDLGRTVRSDQAEFYPREQRATLLGSAEVELENAYLSGNVIESQGGLLKLIGSTATGRAQMILLNTGGLGIGGEAALSSETIALADTILMEEITEGNRFYFSGGVEVLSGAIQLNSDELTLLTAEADAAAATKADDLELGSVESMVAEGVVRVRKSDQLATAERVEFFPVEQRAWLTGSPRIVSGEAIVDGERMNLKANGADIFGSSESPVVVSLPEMPDLGFDPSKEVEMDETESTEEVSVVASTSSEETQSDESVETSEPDPEPVEVTTRQTVIQSETLLMSELENGSLFEFKTNVEVLATNLIANCQRMEVYTRDSAEAGSELDRILAFDSIRVEQLGRVATANTASILPNEGKLILEGEAEIVDDRGTVTGERLTLLQGERRALIEGSSDGKRARITLPALPDTSE